MARTALALLLAIGVAFGSPVVTPARAATGDDIPTVRPFALTEGSGTASFEDQQGSEVWAVYDGFDLDQYLSRSGGPINFSIDVSRNYGQLMRRASRRLVTGSMGRLRGLPSVFMTSTRTTAAPISPQSATRSSSMGPSCPDTYPAPTISGASSRLTFLRRC